MLDELTDWYGNPKTQPKDGRYDGIVAASHVKSYQPLLSGHTFQVKFDGKDGGEDAKKMKDVVDLQWALIAMASIAGAADPLEFSDDDDDDDDMDYGAMEVEPDTAYSEAGVQQWLQGAEASTSPDVPSTPPGRLPHHPPPPQDPTAG